MSNKACSACSFSSFSFSTVPFSLLEVVELGIESSFLEDGSEAK